jgi:hypothetical protein
MHRAQPSNPVSDFRIRISVLPFAYERARISGSDYRAQLGFEAGGEAMRATGHSFCLIGGLAVNPYVEPVVTLDADFAISRAQ